MKKYFIFLLFSFLFCNSQEIEHQEVFKKCKKDYSKKICLSDEDQDGILFYLDKCPKQNGSMDNKGCPWPDTDEDGTLDKDDNCPDTKGDAENNGCPWLDYDGDGVLDKDDKCPTLPASTEDGCPDSNCKEYFKKEKKILEEFKAKNNAEKERFTLLRNTIFNNIPKKFLTGNNIIVSIQVNTFINDNISNCASMSSLWYSKMLFLDQLFWNENTFKYLGKKIKKNIFPATQFGRQPIVRSLLEYYKDNGYYAFIENFSKAPGINTSSPDHEIYYYPGNPQKPEFRADKTRMRVLFEEYEAKNRATVEIIKGSDFQSFTYEYKNGKWNLDDKETKTDYRK